MSDGARDKNGNEQYRMRFFLISNASMNRDETDDESNKQNITVVFRISERDSLLNGFD